MTRNGYMTGLRWIHSVQMIYEKLSLMNMKLLKLKSIVVVEVCLQEVKFIQH